MSILIMNCYDWLNYHIVHEFIENGYSVDGISGPMTKEKEHLSMLIGRNSLFNLITDKEKAEYATVICVGEADYTIDARRFIIINHKGQQAEVRHNRMYIQTPILFGEWMPMDKDGVYVNDAYIAFDSPVFLSTAIYIKDFIDYLLSCIQMNELPKKVNVQSSKKGESEEILLDKSVYIQDNIPIDKRVDQVKKHYDKFKMYYQRI